MPRSALVTGAAGGIGAAIAERLDADGLEVTTLDRAGGCDLELDLAVDELAPRLEEHVRRKLEIARPGYDAG